MCPQDLHKILSSHGRSLQLCSLASKPRLQSCSHLIGNWDPLDSSCCHFAEFSRHLDLCGHCDVDTHQTMSNDTFELNNFPSCNWGWSFISQVGVFYVTQSRGPPIIVTGMPCRAGRGMRDSVRQFGHWCKTMFLVEITNSCFHTKNLLRHFAKQLFKHGESIWNWDACCKII